MWSHVVKKGRRPERAGRVGRLRARREVRTFWMLLRLVVSVVLH